jgi:hypothetical protein
MSRVAVKYKSAASARDIEALEKKHRLTAIRRIPALQIVAYEVAPDVAQALASEEIVDYVEEDGKMRLQ